MSITLALRAPGLRWLPRPVRTPEYWALVGRFAIFGPLIGGLPHAWLVITLPFVFAIGLAPALVAGLLYAAWWFTPGLRRPNRVWRAALGAISGAAGCAAVAGIVDSSAPGIPFVVLAVHGIPAAIVLALVTGSKRRTRRHEQAS